VKVLVEAIGPKTTFQFLLQSILDLKEFEKEKVVANV